jgi:trigger factor
MNQLIMQAAQQYRPEDRQKFVEYVRNEPIAGAQLRAPLFEDKVVDFLFGKAQISERTVSRETLQAEIESTDTGGGHVHGPDCDHGHDHAPKAKAKGKKAKAAGEPEAAKPAKKARAKAAGPAADEAPAEAAKKAKAQPADPPAKKPRSKKKDS